MRIFGRDIRLWQKAPSRDSVELQLRPNDGQGAFTKYFQTFVPRKIEGSFYEFLREAIPVTDAGINRLISLDGHIKVEGNKPELVGEIEEWFYNVPVNDVQKGVQAFHQNLTGEAFEQGFALGEFTTDKKRTDIVGLRVGDSKSIKFSRTGSGIDIYQKADGDTKERLLSPENLMYFSINNENQNPYGVPLLRSTEFVSKILVTMHNSLNNVWERFGDPSFFIKYKTSKKDGTDLEARRKKISDDLNAAVRAKRDNKSADFVAAIDTNSDMEIRIIGADGKILTIEMPARHVLEQIIAKIGLPAWMLGMHWSTTERLSGIEAEMLLADVSIRQAAKMPLFYNLVRNMLLLRGRTWEKGDWTLKYAQVNLQDILKKAQARFMDAQADMYYLQNASAAGIEIDIRDLAIGKMISQGSRIQGAEGSSGRTKTIKQKVIARSGATKQSLCSCGKYHEGSKELSRPTPWPELDKVENEYMGELQSEWDELRKKVMLILRLSDGKGIAALPSDVRGEGKVECEKDNIPSFDTFTFTEIQRAQIMTAMRNYIGIFDLGSDTSAVKWYYGQSYSLGLIQAAKLIGKERPILDIIKNKEIYDELCKSGFRLVKDNATQAITNKILPAMDAHMIAGTNPTQVASVLEKLFGDKNSDWERLARSEMSMAAEIAKLDEWTAWGVKTENKIIPVIDTHPRCRCTNSVREVSGKFICAFTPAPDACPICMSLAQ